MLSPWIERQKDRELSEPRVGREMERPRQRGERKLTRAVSLRRLRGRGRQGGKVQGTCHPPWSPLWKAETEDTGGALDGSLSRVSWASPDSLMPKQALRLGSLS